MFELFFYAAAIVAVLTCYGSHATPQPDFDELFNDHSDNDQPIDLSGTEQVVSQVSELFVKRDSAPSHPAAPISQDVIVPFRRSLKRLGIRELRLRARDEGLKNYSKYTKPQLLQFLQPA